MTEPAASFDRRQDRQGRFPLPRVRRAAAVIDGSGLVDRVAQWKSEVRRGPGGRPETFPLRALLVAMLLAAEDGQPLLATVFCDVLFVQIDEAGRAELGVPDPPAADDHLRWANVYRNVRNRLHGLLDLMDPSDRPKNRRRSDDEFQRAVTARRERCGADLALFFDRLEWFANRIVEASFQLLPRDVRRRWKGTVSVDATPVPAFARPGVQRRGDKWGNDAPTLRHSADPDAGWYARTPDRRDVDDGAPATAKRVWAFEATLAVACPDEPGGDFPGLVAAMAVLHRPGHEVGQNAIRALASLRARGHPAHWLAADRAYSNATPDHFQLPARALGYQPIFDYRIDQLGVQTSYGGFLQVEGDWYCPAVPQVLIDATADLREGRIDEATYEVRIAERAGYRARPKEAPDAEGHVRLRCPAADPAPIARCDLKPKSARRPHAKMVNVPLLGTLKAAPPRCCTQQTITVPPDAGAKFRQTLAYGSEAWHGHYATFRNTVEGANGYLKDGSREALDNPQRRRIRGVAAQTLFVALLIFAGNARKIGAYLAKARRPTLPRRRRRTTPPIQQWQPTTPSTPGEPPHVTATT